MQKIYPSKACSFKVDLKLSMASLLLCCTTSVQAANGPAYLPGNSALLPQSDPAPLTASVSAFVYPGGGNVSCHGAANGIADLTVAGGIAPYNFIWSNGATTEDLNNLQAGNYSVTVTDAAGNTATAGVTLTQPNAITASATTAAALICEGTGTQLNTIANAGPGSAPVAFHTVYNTPILDYQTITSVISVAGIGPEIVNSSTVSGVTVNLNHTFCGDITIWLEAPNGSTISLANRKGGSGDNYTNANFSPNATTAINFVTAPFTGSWLPEEPFSNLNGSLVNGDWKLHVKDNAGLDQGEFLNWTLTLINAGTTYQWSPVSGLSSATIPNPVAAPNTTTNYTVTVTDKFGCSASGQVNVAVNPAPQFDVAAKNISCFGEANGSVAITPTVGTAPFQYSFANNAYAPANSFTDLAAGSYSIKVSDANGCQSATETAIIEEPAPMFAFGFQMFDVPATGFCDGPAGGIELYLEGGTAPYSFLWSNGSTEMNPIGVSDGYYEVLITDANGCTAFASADVYGVTGPDKLVATGVAAQNAAGYNITCYGGSNGSIDVTVNGGVAPYSYSWSNGSTSEDVNNLSAGLHTVTVTDQNGCSTTIEFNLTQPAPVTALAGSDAITYFGYSSGECVTLNGSASGGTGALSLMWNTNATASTITVCPTAPTTYSLTATDAMGCQATDQTLVYVQDVRCGNGKKKDKILVCVNTQNNPHTICVSPNAVAAHLANGGYLGECNSNARITEEEADLVTELTAYPNPFSQATTVKLTTGTDTDVQVQLFDVNGKMVQQLYAGHAEAGVEYTYEVNGDKLPAGMYICRMTSATESTNVKLVLTK